MKRFYYLLFAVAMFVIQCNLTSCGKDDPDVNKNQEKEIDTNSDPVEFQWLDETTFLLNGIKYRIIEASNVGVIGYFGLKPIGELSIPSSIKTKMAQFNVIEISKEAFYNCENITSIILGDKIKKICIRAFANCTNLTNISFSKGLIEIGESAFSNCPKLSNLKFPDSLTTIKIRAFSDCVSIKSIFIPSNVSSIGECDEVFYVPAQWGSVGITGNGGNPFVGCEGINSIQVDTNNLFFDSRNNCNAIIRKSDKLLISGCKTSVIPEGVEVIGSSSFRNLKDITSIRLPNTLRKIENRAFFHVESLEEVSFPNNLKEIGRGAFQGCMLLKKIVIPDAVETIADNAFCNCESLEFCSMTNSTKRIGAGCFRECISLKNLTLSENIECIGSYMFYGCTSLTTIIIPQNIKDIGEKSFKDCPNLSSITVHCSIPPLFPLSLYDNFDDITFSKATLYVPYNSLEEYRVNDIWGKFTNIKVINL